MRWGANTSCGKCLRLEVTMTCALSWTAAATTCLLRLESAVLLPEAPEVQTRRPPGMLHASFGGDSQPVRLCIRIFVGVYASPLRESARSKARGRAPDLPRNEATCHKEALAPGRKRPAPPHIRYRASGSIQRRSVVCSLFELSTRQIVEDLTTGRVTPTLVSQNVTRIEPSMRADHVKGNLVLFQKLD